MLSAGAVNALIVELRSPDVTAARADEIKSEIVDGHQGLIRHFIRLRDPQLYEDLVQIGTIGVLAAIDKFDIGRNVSFGTFAGEHIKGELSHFYRDDGAIRISRSVKSHLSQIRAAQDAFIAKNNAQPSFTELENCVNLNRGEILNALQANYSTHISSLNDPDLHIDIADSRDEFDFIDEWESVRPSIELLSPLDRKILGMRFIEQKKQGEIADELGMNQMAVSRRLTAVLEQLRLEVNTE
jgi:RNA polymerase sigma factor (sigma-70 family)